MTSLHILAAILLPPLGVYLSAGLGPAFWAALVLTLLFFVPGVIFALFTVLRGAPAWLARVAPAR